MMHEQRYRKGDVILTEGQRGGEAYVPGQIFGEMALITDDPRSASVRALERVEVGVIARDEFLGHLRDTPDVLMPFLSTLAERIRNLNGLVEELARRSPGNRDAVRAHLGMHAPGGQQGSVNGGVKVTVEGITPRANEVLNGRPVVVQQFPFRIGRQTSPDDPFSANELAIPDGSPWWISPSHCMLSHVGDRCFIIDRGSRLGTLVDGKMVGGTKQTGRLELESGDHEVRLGGALTPFRFSLNVAGAAKNGHHPHRRRS